MLHGAAVGAEVAVYFPDERRLGLRGQVRRVLAPRGVKGVQKVQLTYAYCSRLLAGDPLRGGVRWQWVERMSAEALRPVLAQWALPVVVWDGAPSHRSETLEKLPTRRNRQPAYSPELNPAELVFEEVRRWAEGTVYASLKAKQQAAEAYLRTRQAHPERVKRLCGWDWIRAALQSLPPAQAA